MQEILEIKMKKINILLDLYFTFFKIGFVTFGGGLAMLPILERELVEKRKWVGSEELIDYFSIGQSTPGIIAVNVATFCGNKCFKEDKNEPFKFFNHRPYLNINIMCYK